MSTPPQQILRRTGPTILFSTIGFCFRDSRCEENALSPSSAEFSVSPNVLCCRLPLKRHISAICLFFPHWKHFAFLNVQAISECSLLPHRSHASDGPRCSLLYWRDGPGRCLPA
ncbi:unnamed protein product, partial [Ixodes pacificus]